VDQQRDYSWLDGFELGETFRNLSTPIQWMLVSVLMEGSMSNSSWINGLIAVALSAAIVVFPLAARAKKGIEIPAPAIDASLAQTSGQESVVFAGGCFWGIQAVFQHVNGVVSATSGYSGGEAKTADYEVVSTGRTGHAESVKVVFDPSQITYGQLLHVFFSVAHDPTELNRQGPDEGSQYRSVVFYSSPDQLRITKAYIEQLNAAHVFKHEIVTQLVPLKEFYPAEAYHQNYATVHPDSMYIRFNDAPKVENLKKDFPQMYRESPNLVAVK
jgi:peptide-methionine (S)-S-oxide reductase